MDHSAKVKRQINPREKANTLSIATFLYTRSLFIRGFKTDLQDEDLYEVTKRCRSKKCGDKLEQLHLANIKVSNGQVKNESIYKQLWSIFGLRYIILGLVNMTGRLLVNVVEPEAIANLVAYFKPGQTKMDFDDVLHYALILIGVRLMHAFYFHNYMFLTQEISARIRAAVSSLIYRKALKLSPKALEHTSLGNIITIISKDVQQFDAAVGNINNLWISVIETFVICYLIYMRTGVASVVGISMLIGVLPFQAFTASMIRKFRLKMCSKIDERLQRTQETLSTIKTVKMYTWEQVLADKIGEARFKELKLLVKTSYARMALIVSSVLVAKLSFYVLIMMYIYIHNEMSAEDIFYVMKLFNSLRACVAVAFSSGFSKLGEVMASLKRIDFVLQLEELPDFVDKPDDEPQIDLRNVSVILHKEDILKNVNLKLEKGLNVITGDIGSGKSSLIKVILRDYPIEDDGEVITRGRKSYASQDPWLFPSSIRQNILFGEKYEYERYNQVISACALKYDFEIVENGDQTIVADRGMNLSKGQQARVNLARAIYRHSDIYLLDDTLSALDSKVQEHIFTYCIQGLLRDKCVVLVTHNSKHIEAADKIVILKDGAVSLIKEQQNLSIERVEPFKTVQIENLQIKKTVKTKETVNITEETDEKTKLIEASIPERKKVYREINKTGSVDLDLYIAYFKMGGGIIMSIILLIAYGGFSFFDNYAQKSLTNWINQKSDVTSLREHYLSGTTINLEDVDIENKTTVFLNSTFNVSTEVIKKIGKLEIQATKSINMYTIMIFSFAAIELIRYYIIWRFGFFVSNNLHRKMINRVLKAAMSFFDSVFIGNILNRFSQDLNVVDEFLTISVADLIGDIFSLAGITGLIVSVDWRFIIPAIILAMFSIIARTVYIRTVRNLKRLSAACRSPIIGHLNSTMDGLTTVRAYKAEEILKHEFDTHQDLYTSSLYMFASSKSAFSFLMEITSITFSCTVIIRFLFFDTGIYAGDVGLTLTQAALLTSKVNGVLQVMTYVENNMTSFERAMEYSEVEVEEETGATIKDWPKNGEISYEKVSLTYTNSHEKMLKGVSFTVQPKTKIGIVGRTGAGKTSIISVLYRLYNYDGQIYIDGVELKTLSLKFLRQHISIIPQDPIMFSGTVRSNIDPLEEFTDEEIWKTLHKVHLDSKIPDLQAQVVDVNFTTGQRQLICLARAIIRKNKIVVLDEATANMDPETEQLAEKIIEENFNNCTLLIIAHRLEAILHCDRILVLNRGEIAEFDAPQVLLQDKTSLFSDMMRNAAKLA